VYLNGHVVSHISYCMLHKYSYLLLLGGIVSTHPLHFTTLGVIEYDRQKAEKYRTSVLSEPHHMHTRTPFMNQHTVYIVYDILRTGIFQPPPSSRPILVPICPSFRCVCPSLSLHPHVKIFNIKQDVASTVNVVVCTCLFYFVAVARMDNTSTMT